MRDYERPEFLDALQAVFNANPLGDKVLPAALVIQETVKVMNWRAAEKERLRREAAEATCGGCDAPSDYRSDGCGYCDDCLPELLFEEMMEGGWECRERLFAQAIRILEEQEVFGGGQACALRALLRLAGTHSEYSDYGIDRLEAEHAMSVVEAAVFPEVATVLQVLCERFIEEAEGEPVGQNGNGA